MCAVLAKSDAGCLAGSALYLQHHTAHVPAAPGRLPHWHIGMACHRRKGTRSPALIMDWKLLVEHPGALATLVALQQNSHHDKVCSACLAYW